MDNLSDFYSENYKQFIGSGLVGKVAELSHKSIERKRFRKSDSPKPANYTILELGAGNGQHSRHVREDFSKYFLSDLRPHNLPVSTDKIISLPQSIDAESLPFPDNSFDRVIATCLIAHLSHPEIAIQEWLRVTKVGGSIQVYVPCEPGWMLRNLQFLITNPKKKKLGVQNPRLLNYLDHVTYHPRIKEICKSACSDLRIRNYPFPFFSWNFNLWSVFYIRKI